MRKTVTAVILALATALGSMQIVSARAASASSSRTYVYAAGWEASGKVQLSVPGPLRLVPITP